MIDIAKKRGVYFAPNTLVKNLIQQNGYVVGVETELEKYYAPIVILADGVNSLLAKELNLREKHMEYRVSRKTVGIFQIKD